jgi:hypothetical protein
MKPWMSDEVIILLTVPKSNPVIAFLQFDGREPSHPVVPTAHNSL